MRSIQLGNVHAGRHVSGVRVRVIWRRRCVSPLTLLATCGWLCFGSPFTINSLHLPLLAPPALHFNAHTRAAISVTKPVSSHRDAYILCVFPPLLTQIYEMVEFVFVRFIVRRHTSIPFILCHFPTQQSVWRRQQSCVCPYTYVRNTNHTPISNFIKIVYGIWIGFRFGSFHTIASSDGQVKYLAIRTFQISNSNLMRVAIHSWHRFEFIGISLEYTSWPHAQLPYPNREQRSHLMMDAETHFGGKIEMGRWMYQL